MRQYLIYDYRPPRGGHWVNAYPTCNRPWEKLRELLGPDVCNSAIVQAESKPAALVKAKLRWLGNELPTGTLKSENSTKSNSHN